MSKTITGKDVIRAWKDADYRESLSGEDRAALPNNPAGLVDLSDAELESVRGAALDATPGVLAGFGTNNSGYWWCPWQTLVPAEPISGLEKP